MIDVKITETDEYGRKMFSFITGRVYGVCIMQNNDERYVYYYDNESYLLSEQYNPFTADQLYALKEANDWNEPLDDDKMINRELVDAYSLKPDRKSVLAYENAKSAFYETNDEEGYITSIQFFDYSQSQQEIFLVMRHEQIITEENYKLILIDYHFMILNADGTYDPENYLIKIDDLSQSNEALAAIKERNGWVG